MLHLHAPHAWLQHPMLRGELVHHELDLVPVQVLHIHQVSPQLFKRLVTLPQQLNCCNIPGRQNQNRNANETAQQQQQLDRKCASPHMSRHQA